MKRVFRQEKDGYAAGTTGLTIKIASTLALLGLCYIFTPFFVGARGGLPANACGIVQGGTLHQEIYAAADVGKMRIPSVCQQCGGGASIGSSGIGSRQSDQPRLRTSNEPAITADSTNSDDIWMMVSLSTPDRHWCMAEAFNAALDRKKLDFPMRQTSVVAVR